MLAGGDPIAALAPVDPSPLIPFARWRPDHMPSRMFDTWFYVARLPENAPPAQVDATENAHALWITAADALRAADRGDAMLLFPTRRVLERLAQHDDVADVLADAARWPVRTITPWIEQRAGGRFVCIPDDLGYPVTAEAADRAVRA